jgi:serine phosphatase RsbU (regulator of sigma subunit)
VVKTTMRPKTINGSHAGPDAVRRVGPAERALTRAALPVPPDQALAAAVQHASLPVLAEVPGVEIAAAYVPAANESLLGGDWYDAYEIDDKRLGLSIGDVCGHGLEAAGLMAQLRNALRAHAFNEVEPGDALRATSTMLERCGGGAFATAIHATLNRRSGELVWARAGHLPIVLHAADEARLVADHGGPPLGVGREAYATNSMHLAPDDTVVLYTDGLVESPNTPLDEGLRRLTAAVADEMSDQAADRAMTICPPAPRDDVCVLTVRRALVDRS